MTIRNALEEGIKKLNSANILEAKLDTEYLLCYVLDCQRIDLILDARKEMTKEQYETYVSLIQRRCEHVPLQYILGEQNFMGYSFYVKPGVLIPRQDTEILVEQAVKRIKIMRQKQPRILDLCCGSGCIGLSIKKLYPDIQLTLVDLSDSAIEVTNRNRERLEVDAEILQSDLFTNVSEKYHMIVSNPPYIRTKDIETLMPEVKEYEPFMALDGLEDGLHFYRKIIEKARSYLYEQGEILFEIGFDQAEDVRKIFVANQFSNCKVYQDLAGLDRVVTARI